MKTEHYNQLTEAEQELLAILAEECGEVVQAVMKVIRHGWNPAVFTCDNRGDIEKECGDVRRAMIELCKAGLLSKERIHAHAEVTHLGKAAYIHHQGIRDSEDLDDGA